MRISLARFRRLVAEALDELPAEFHRRIENVQVVVQSLPSRQLKDRHSGLLLGLYHGIPLSQRSIMASGELPDMIFIFQRNIERICSSEEEIRTQVRDTVMHEIGHHFGLSEEELEDV